MIPNLFLTLKKPNLTHKHIKDTSSSHPKLVTQTHYLLHFITGRITLPFFKKLLLSPKVKEIVVYARNVENFEFVFREFRDLVFVPRKYNTVPSYKDEYVYSDKMQTFEPRIFDCAITSLIRPDLYINEGNKSTKIIRELSGGNGRDLAVNKELMSLVHFGAVSKTKKGYETTF
ncbi:hypothetical protein VCUG_00613 [Vavraia culicis subsp. floridensis]|uniref:Uncharacterized protein n=1 Tax=Vavraia culicis (isolate floridensis) TaxID=948595 RepID=L2GXA2_VAVCU|nr:uncharacterized protein VCUG_00613 [Vavraia culicis subsp. floridensis]ELA47893.1 hypothetical protein VCUG_00613 [Vavraia culicis subsp. floridensis]